MILQLGSKLKEANTICIFVHGRGQSPEAMQDHVINRLSAPSVPIFCREPHLALGILLAV